MLLGIGMFLLADFERRQDPVTDGYVTRKEYGQGEETVRLLVEGLEDKAVEISFPVEERQYSGDEARAAAKELGKRLEDLILGENESLSKVWTDLALITRDSQTGFRIRWSSGDPDLVEVSGAVHGEGADPVSGSEVLLTAEVSDGTGSAHSFSFLVTVFPPVLSEAEQSRKGLADQIREQEARTREEAGFRLPNEYEGKTLRYRRYGSGESVWLLAAGPLLAVLLRAREKSQAREKQKTREKQLLLDYSEVVSKLQIFLGAGMTVRSAWERIVLDYQELRRRGAEERPAYEEMMKTYHQLKSGAPEGKAYEEFGRRCMLPPYLKLAGLLEQNRKTGTRNLRQLLQLEVTDAFEQRKNLARRQGEEAATKLLLPLFLMLGVVMVIVAVPAFLTFY